MWEGGGVCGGGSSVVCDGRQLGVQVHGDVLVQGAERDLRAVLEVVEAVQVLPLFGIPQQLVSVGQRPGSTALSQLN